MHSQSWRATFFSTLRASKVQLLLKKRRICCILEKTEWPRGAIDEHSAQAVADEAVCCFRAGNRPRRCCTRSLKALAPTACIDPEFADEGTVEAVFCRSAKSPAVRSGSVLPFGL